MIVNKNDLQYYLACDKVALGIKKSQPKLFRDEIWRFERVLRKAEFFNNQIGGGFC